MSENPRGLNLDELARQLVGAIPQNLKALSEDMERNVKALLQSGLERMDLVTREEFDLQSAVLERTREKLEALEARLAELEARQAGASAPGAVRAEEAAAAAAAAGAGGAAGTGGTDGARATGDTAGPGAPGSTEPSSTRGVTPPGQEPKPD